MVMKAFFIPAASTLFLATMTSTVSTTRSQHFINKMAEIKFSDSSKFSEDNLKYWFESSDTVRQPGMSKATLTLQKLNKEFIGVDQRAIFFALLNPQPNGAGFAGMKRWLNQIDFTDVTTTSENQGVRLICRAQGLTHWKVIFYHNMENVDPKVTYESFFDATSTSEFNEIKLDFESFQAYSRGRPVDTEALDRNNIAGIGLQTYGGVYSVDHQNGPGALEIESIVVTL